MTATILPIRGELQLDNISLDKEKTEDLVTLGSVIGMMRKVLGAIIEGIDQSGKVARNLLEANMKSMMDAAQSIRISQEKRATGMSSSAMISISIGALAIGAGVGGFMKSTQNAAKMRKVQDTPIGQPSIANGSAIEMQSLSKSAVDKIKNPVANGAKNLKEDITSVKFTQGTLADPKGKVFSSDTAKANELKVLEKEGSNNIFTTLGYPLNQAMGPAGSLEQSRYEQQSAQAQYAGEMLRGTSDSVKSQRNEAEHLLGSLPDQVSRFASFVGIVLETMKASAQWR